MFWKLFYLKGITVVNIKKGGMHNSDVETITAHAEFKKQFLMDQPGLFCSIA